MLTIKCDQCGKEEEVTLNDLKRWAGSWHRRSDFSVLTIGTNEYHACGSECESIIRQPLSNATKSIEHEAES